MPAIAAQVATIEHDLQEALAKIDSLTEEREMLKKALAAITVEKSELEVKHDDMQSLVDETREMVDRLANMSLNMLRLSRRPIASPKEAAGYNATEPSTARVARQVWANARWPEARKASRIRDAVAKLAEYIVAADKRGLQGDPFRNGAAQMLAPAKTKKEATAGPPLPFGPMAIGATKWQNVYISE
jgi:hypothetical protein